MNAISLINGNKLSPFEDLAGGKNIYLNQHVTLFKGQIQTKNLARQRIFTALKHQFGAGVRQPGSLLQRAKFPDPGIMLAMTQNWNKMPPLF